MCFSASLYNGVQFFISHLASWLRTRALASLLIDPPEPQTIGKTQCFATYLFGLLDLFFLLRLSLFDLLSSSLVFSDSSHLCFSSVHIVGSLASKLPSMIIYPEWGNKNSGTIGYSEKYCIVTGYNEDTMGVISIPFTLYPFRFPYVLFPIVNS